MKPAVLCAILISCLVGGSAAASGQVFIPRTPLTPPQRAEYQAMLVGQGRSPEQAAGIVDYSSNIYATAAFRMAFPTLQATDEMVSACSNDMMGGASSVVFLSPPALHMVKVTWIGCQPADGGIECGQPQQASMYFFDSVKARFRLGEGVSHVEAVAVLKLFRDQGIRNLPDWFKGVGYQSVNKITRDGDVYSLHAGEFFCGGCTYTIPVRLETDRAGQRALVSAGGGEGLCI